MSKGILKAFGNSTEKVDEELKNKVKGNVWLFELKQYSWSPLYIKTGLLAHVFQIHSYECMISLYLCWLKKIIQYSKGKYFRKI